MKPKVFHWEGVKLMLVEREEPLYEGSTETWKPVRAIGPNGGVIPVNFNDRGYKNAVDAVITTLDGFARARSIEEVIHELTREV